MVGYSFLVCLKATRPGEILHVRQCHVGCLTQDGNLRVLTSPDADKLKILRCCVWWTGWYCSHRFYKLLFRNKSIPLKFNNLQGLAADRRMSNAQTAYTKKNKWLNNHFLCYMQISSSVLYACLQFCIQSITNTSTDSYSTSLQLFLPLKTSLWSSN